MSTLSRELCLPACLGIGVALYVYSAFLMPRGDERIETAETAAAQPVKSEPQHPKPQSVEPQPIKLAPLKPKPKLAASPSPAVTGAINPEAAASPKTEAGPRHAIVPETGSRTATSDPMPMVPGIRVASAAPQATAIQSPDATRWSPAVGYAPIAKGKPMSTNQQVLPPPRAKKYRVVRRPYRRHTNFRVVIGVGPRW